MTLKVATEVVQFGDGSELEVSESNWTIAMKLSRLEREANASPLPDEDDQLFHVHFYPKLAAATTAVNGTPVPSEEEARAMPTAELDKWFEAVRRKNPSWFLTVDQNETPHQEQKKRKRHKQSSSNG